MFGIAGMFFLSGVLVSAYGPLLEHLSHRFAVSLTASGAVLSTHFAGGLAGVLVSMLVLRRAPIREFIWVVQALIAVGCTVLALAPSWPAFLAGVLVLGVGIGAQVICLNQLVAHGGSRRRLLILNALNASYGIGAVAGPLLVASVGRTNLPLMYGGAAVFAAALILVVAGVSGRLPFAIGRPAGRARVLVGVFMVGFVLYVGVENGIGGWMPSHLESTGFGSVAAANLTSAFWLALAAGRMLIALAPARLPEPALVIGGAGAAAAALLVAVFNGVAPVAYIVVGLVIAPIFPTGIVWLARLTPGDARSTSWLFPAAMLGGALIPGGIGVAIGQVGIRWTPVLLAVVAAGCAVAFWVAAVVGSGATEAKPAPKLD
jgi:FHS family glucose/mannose:H+ symporter-like MFS transporter